MNNKQGSALIETLLLLPLFILLLYLEQRVSVGWSFRIKNRLLCRYVSTHYFRTNEIPSPLKLIQNFELSPLDLNKLKIKSPSQTEWRFQNFTIHHTYYLWR